MTSTRVEDFKLEDWLPYWLSPNDLIAFLAALLLDHLADVPDVVFGQILDADVGADPGRLQNRVRAEAPDAIDVGETNLDALGPREINACNSRHILIPAAACAFDSSK